MQHSHIISEMVLAISGFFVFFNYLKKQNKTFNVLWGTFILSVSIAAFFAALRFAGFAKFDIFNLFFKQIAATAGVMYLTIVIYFNVTNNQISKKTMFGTVLSGIITAFTCISFQFQKVIDIIPMFGILVVFLLGIWALKKRNNKLGSYLVLATFFASLANFIQIFNLPIDEIDSYCVLLAMALICFGFAAKSNPIPKQEIIKKI